MIVDFEVILKRKGITQTELANRLEMHPQNLSRVIKSDDIKLSVLIKIANAINESLGYVLGIEVEKTHSSDNRFLSIIEAQQKTIDTLAKSVEALSQKGGDVGNAKSAVG